MDPNCLPTFTLHTVRKVVFGWGEIAALPREASSLGRRVLLVTGGRSLRASGRLGAIQTSLAEAGLQTECFEGVEPEPSTGTVERAREQALAFGAEVLVGIGGGSSMDVARAAAGLLRDDLPVADRLAVAGEPAREVGLILCPTTSGTGSEATMTTVLTDHARGIKSSLRHPTWLADVALVDPELTLTAPPAVTAATGLDALVQALESYVSRGANPATDALAEEAARLLFESLEMAWRDGECRWAREKASLGSLLAGMALSNARLGLVHGLAHPVGVRTRAAHGLVCAILLEAVLTFNRSACEEKLARLSRRLGLSSHDAPDAMAADAFVARTLALRRTLGVTQGLSDLGLDLDDLGAVARESLNSGSTKANPRPVSASDAISVLRAAFEG